MYCKVHYRVASSPEAQHQQELLLDQFVLNLQTPDSTDPIDATSSTLDTGAPDAQLPGQSQPAQSAQPSQLNESQPQRPQPAQLIPLATVLDSAQGDASWFASPRNAQLMLESAQLTSTQLRVAQT